MNPLRVTGRILPISDATKARNPELFRRPQATPSMGAVGAKEHKPTTGPALVADLSARPTGASGMGSVLVTITAYRNRWCDADNSANGYKKLQDSISRSLQIDDGSERIRFEYSQVRTDGPEGTCVRIAWL